ncbi:MAG: FGGY-family carbohydrate kinase [Clostridia bacterium]
MAYLALDVGTSSAKAAIISERGYIIASARSEYTLFYPATGGTELEPDKVWAGVQTVLKALAPQMGTVTAMAISSLGESFVLLDEMDRPLCNSMTYLDMRGVQELEQIQAAFDSDALLTLTGTPPNVMYSLVKLCYLKRHAPESYRRAKKICLYGDYIGYLLTGERVIDASLASRTMLLDVHTGTWSDQLLEHFQIDRSLLSRVVFAGAPVGRVKSDMARSLELPEGIMLYAGCHDQCCATLGAGLFRAGDMMAGVGSSESVIVLIDREKVDPPMPVLLRRQLSFEPFVHPDCFAITLGQATYGTSLRWYVQTYEDRLRDECARDGRDVFEALDALAADDSRDCVFLPYLARTQPMEKESCAPGAFLGLDLKTYRGEMYQAVLEALCMETRINCDILDDLALKPSRIVATGGCSRSSRHMQIKADVLGLPVETLQEANSGLVGLAMLLAVSCGDYRDLADCAKVFVHQDARYVPTQDYHDKLIRYREIRSAIQSLYHGHEAK